MSSGTCNQECIIVLCELYHKSCQETRSVLSDEQSVFRILFDSYSIYVMDTAVGYVMKNASYYASYVQKSARDKVRFV